MSLTSTFYEVTVKEAPTQKVLVDSVTEESPILKSMPLQQTSNGMINVYEEQNEITGASLVNMDEELPSIDSNSNLKQVVLSVLGGKMIVGEDKAKMYPGGKDSYFANKLPSILRETGMNTEYSIFYNNLRAFAAAESKLLDGGGSGSTNYTMMCVRWMPGELTGLYDAAGFGNGKVFDMTPINGGLLYEDPTTNRLVYGMRIKSYIGIQLANPRFISGIVNCDIVNDDPTGTRTFPTEAMIDDMILNARGGMSNTAIYCHPKVKTYLGTLYKGSRMTTVVNDNELNFSIDMWDDVPIITSYNLAAGNEAKVTV